MIRVEVVVKQRVALSRGFYGQRRQMSPHAPQISPQDLAMCIRMGVKPADYVALVRHDVISKALSDGRLAPSQKAWAEKQTLQSLTDYLDASL